MNRYSLTNTPRETNANLTLLAFGKFAMARRQRGRL